MSEQAVVMRPPLEALQDKSPLLDHYGAADKSNSAVIRRAVRIGSSGILFAEDKIGELLDPAPVLHIVPHTTTWFSGVVNIRGNIVPIFDIALLLNNQRSAGKNTRLFVYGKGDGMVAFYTDDVPTRMTLDSKHLLMQSPLETTLDQYIQATYALNDVIWLDIDMEAMFSGLAARIKSRG